MPSAWHQQIVGQSILAGTPFEASMIKNGIDETSVEGVADSPYVDGTPHHFVALHSPKTACRCSGGARSATRTPPSRWRR